MSNSNLNLNIEQEENSYRKTKRYQFDSSFISETLNKSHSKKSSLDQTLNQNNPKPHFSYKEFQPKNYFKHKLLHSKSTKSISTSATVSNDQSAVIHKSFTKPNTTSVNLNQPISSLVIAQTKQDIHKRINTLNSWVNHVKTKGFDKYKEVIVKREKKRETIAYFNSGITTHIKSTKRDANNAYLSHGKLSLETSTYKERAFSQINRRINPNQIVTIKVDLPKYNPQIMRLNKEKDKMNKQAENIKEEVAMVQNSIQMTTLNISEQEKENERIRKEILVMRKKIISVKEKIYFCFDNTNKNMQNVYQLIKDKSLYTNEN